MHAKPHPYTLCSQIDYVVGDKPLTIGDELAPAPPAGGSGAGAGAAVRGRKLPEQLEAPWGLDQIDQASLPLDSMYHFDSWGARNRGCDGAGRARLMA